MWARIKERLYYWYLFSNTKKVLDTVVGLLSAVLTCIVYIPIVFIVIIWLFLAGKRT